MKKINKNLKKFFMSPEGEIFSTEGLHETIAREICDSEKWDWRSKSVSADEFLQEYKGYVKVANYDYGECQFRYVSMNKKFIRNKRVIDNADFIASVLNLKIEVY